MPGTATIGAPAELRNSSGTEVGTDSAPLRTSPASGAASQPVSGTVTANAGTNLNTSLLALEAGGNLAGAATSLAIIDDWDETDRAKVNIIAGQVGAQGGSGVVTALTQRVVLATDVTLPAAPTGSSANQVQGTAAVDAPAVGNPVRTGSCGQAADITAVTAGDAVDFLLKQNQDLDALLTARGVRHEFALTAGNHSWPVWCRYLGEFLPKLFVK